MNLTIVGWLFGVIYVLGYLAWWRTVCWHVTIDVVGDWRRVDGIDLAFGLFFGSLFTAAWPLITLAAAVRKVYALKGESMTALIIPRNQKRRIELDERERRIHELERELNIK